MTSSSVATMQLSKYPTLPAAPRSAIPAAGPPGVHVPDRRPDDGSRVAAARLSVMPWSASRLRIAFPPRPAYSHRREAYLRIPLTRRRPYAFLTKSKTTRAFP